MLQYEPKIPFRRLLLYIYRCSTVVCFTSGNIDIILNIFKRIENSMNVQWYYENNLQLFIGGLSKEKKKLWKLSFTNFRILVDHFRGLFLKNIQNIHPTFGYFYISQLSLHYYQTSPNTTSLYHTNKSFSLFLDILQILLFLVNLSFSCI